MSDVESFHTHWPGDGIVSVMYALNDDFDPVSTRK